nr:hypothetical protein [uncultured Acetatifactor sp.]
MEARRAGGPREETIWAGAQMEARRAGMMWDETIGAGAGGLCDVRRGYRSADGGHGRPECCEARPLECRLRPEGLRCCGTETTGKYGVVHRGKRAGKRRQACRL